MNGKTKAKRKKMGPQTLTEEKRALHTVMMLLEFGISLFGWPRFRRSLYFGFMFDYVHWPIVHSMLPIK